MQTQKKATGGQPVTKESDTSSLPIDRPKINQAEVAQELAAKVQKAGYPCRVATDCEVAK